MNELEQEKKVVKKPINNNFLHDVKGNRSSKRLITFIAFTLVSVAFGVNVFKELPLEEYVWDGMVGIVMVGLGATAAEHFSSKY